MISKILVTPWREPAFDITSGGGNINEDGEEMAISSKCVSDTCKLAVNKKAFPTMLRGSEVISVSSINNRFKATHWPMPYVKDVSLRFLERLRSCNDT